MATCQKKSKNAWMESIKGYKYLKGNGEGRENNENSSMGIKIQQIY